MTALALGTREAKKSKNRELSNPATTTIVKDRWTIEAASHATIPGFILSPITMIEPIRIIFRIYYDPLFETP